MPRPLVTRQRARSLPRAIAAVLLIASPGLHALAAPPASEFAVTAAQMESLGITLLKIERPAPIRGMAYPAKVVVPPNAEQVVSAPVDGVVDRLLVGGQEIAKAGQPLLRLASPSTANCNSS